MTDMLSAPVALHTAARRYLIEYHDHWTSRYAEIGGSPSGGYGRRQLDTFPRYHVLAAILEAVQRLVPTGWAGLDEAREQLAWAGDTAENIFTQPPTAEIAARAMEDEREKFVRFVRNLSEAELAAVEPLPYCRVLSEAECDALREQLKTAWGIDQDYWYPLDGDPPPDVAVFQAPHFEKALCPEPLQAILHQRGIERIWELREHGPSYEIELSALAPYYDGAEGFWFSSEGDWLLYASHESSITAVGKTLIAAIEQAWPEWKRHIWTTPYF